MIRKFAGFPLSTGFSSTSGLMWVVGMSLKVRSNQWFPVLTATAVATTTTTSAIAKRPAKTLNEEPGATTHGIVLAVHLRPAARFVEISRLFRAAPTRRVGRGRAR